MKTNFILIGMPASGKSTLGILLAQQLGKQFLDTDQILQAQTGKSLQQILNQKGLSRFLQLEEEALLSIDTENTVIATGGSVIYSQRGMQHLKEHGICIYLSVPYSVIQARLRNLKTRGVAISQGKTLWELYHERVPLYEAYADLVFQEEPRNLDRKTNTANLIAFLQEKQLLLESN